MAKQINKLWLAWESDGSIRSKVLARELRVDFFAITDFTGSRYFFWLRYPVAIIKTFRLLLRIRPKLLFVQNPSIILALEAALLKPIFGFRLIIDLHTLYINLSGVKKIVLNFLSNYGIKNCDTVIVTNNAHKDMLSVKTVQPIMVLPDKIPDFEYEFTPYPLKDGYNILFICTFSSDEPWQKVIEAANLLPDDTTIYISGRNLIKQEHVPKNVIVTGYLKNEEYQNLLRSVDAVMVLTTANNCLVCGGYEAVAAGKPLVLSDTTALQNFFYKGAIFTANDSQSIACAIASVRINTMTLANDVRNLRAEMVTSWVENWRNVTKKLEIL